MFKSIIDYVFPPTCSFCSEFTYQSHHFCNKCWIKLGFISKPYCQTCGKPFELDISEGLICGRCLQTPPSYDFARSLLRFDENSKKVIHSFKYHDKVEFGKIFSNLLFRFYHHEINHIDYVVPVPMNRLKRLFRMYNQADLLGIHIAKKLNKPVICDALIKLRWTRSQVYLNRKARKDNLKNSLKLNSMYDVKNKTILLIDDVMTTGSTLEYCSKILKSAGTKSVIALTVAMR